MLLAFAVGSVVVSVLIMLLGWKHQARKTPEEIHMDLLIDTNDPYAVAYSTKVWGPPSIGVMDYETGTPYVLI